MKKILAVNVDPFNLNIISNMLTEHTSEFEVLTTQNIKEVDDIIRKLATDIIIVDLDNPSPQDLKTLAGISKAYPRLPLFLLTAFETGEIESAVKAIGTARYFEKPVDLKEIVDLIWAKIEKSVSGMVQGISLTSFLQMSEMEKTSCTLNIKSGKKSGSLYMAKGVLIAAEAGERQNEEAVFEILSWENPSIEIDDSPINRKKEIQAPLISLLMESVKRKDEKEKPASKKAVPKKKAVKTAAAPIPADAKQKIAEMESVAPEIEEIQTSAKITDASRALKRQQMVKRAVIGAAVLLVLIVAACLWQFVYSPWQADKKFSQVVADVTAAKSMKKKVALLDAYLATEPSSHYMLKAQNIKQDYAVKLEKEEFDRIVHEINALPINDDFQRRAREMYVNFLTEFPDTALKDEVDQRIQNIPFMMDDAEFALLKKIPKHHYSQRLTAYQKYLERHEKSVNANSVREMIDNLGEAFFQHIKREKAGCDQEQSWQECIKLCNYFLDNFKQHIRHRAVTALLQEMSARVAYAKISETVEKAGPLSAEAQTILENHLKDYPDSPVRKTVLDQLARIRENNSRENAWQDLLNFVKNDRNSIFERVDRMARYIEQQPSGKHKTDAENIYTWLLREKQRTQQEMNQKAEARKRQQQQKQYIDREKERITRQVEQSNGRYMVNREDTVTDRQTGLTWCMLDSLVLSSKCMDYKTARKYVRNLKTGGYNDWRLPDPSELLVLYNSKPGFPLSDARWYWTSESFHAAWEKKVNTVVRTDSGQWKKAETNLEKCGAVRAVRP